MELIYTDKAKAWQGVVRHFSLDMAYGYDENDFALTVPSGSPLTVGGYVFEHGTERGGVIDSVTFNGEEDVKTLTYGGRTWHGILAGSIVRPSSGQSYVTVTGDLNDVIGQLIERQGLEDVFQASSTPCGKTVSSYRLPRYVNALESMMRLVKSKGMRLSIHRESAKTVIEAVPAVSHDDGSVSDLTVRMTATRSDRPVNHLVLLGEGQLSSRLVLDVYADKDGNVSTTQTLFGIDEVAEVYERSTEDDSAKLLEDGLEELAEMQEFAQVALSIADGSEYALGDTVKAYATEVGITAKAEIVKVIVNVGDDGLASVAYEVGEPRVTASR